MQRASVDSDGTLEGSPKVGKRKGGMRTLSHNERQRFFTAFCVLAWFLLNVLRAVIPKQKVLPMHCSL